MNDELRTRIRNAISERNKDRTLAWLIADSISTMAIHIDLETTKLNDEEQLALFFVLRGAALGVTELLDRIEYSDDHIDELLKEGGVL